MTARLVRLLVDEEAARRRAQFAGCFTFRHPDEYKSSSFLELSGDFRSPDRKRRVGRNITREDET